MKLVVLQCADFTAMKRGWAYPDQHNVFASLDDLEPRRDTLDATWGDELAADEQAEEQILG